MEAQNVLEAIKIRLASYPEVKRAILFGSRARGESRAESDFDLCLVVENGSDARSLYIRLMREFASADRSIDLMILSESDYRRKLDEGWTVLKAVDREGRLVYAA